jgi:hypothetical protein
LRASAFFFFLVEQEATEVHQPADRRFGVRHDLDQIQLASVAFSLAARRSNDADLISVGADQADLRAVISSLTRLRFVAAIVGSSGRH